MKRNHNDARGVGVAKRMRRRRLRAYRARQALEREIAAPRADHLALLAQLCGTLECGHFSDAQLLDARHALMQRNPDSPQGTLALTTSEADA